jgi:hypothetical protein
MECDDSHARFIDDDTTPSAFAAIAPFGRSLFQDDVLPSNASRQRRRACCQSNAQASAARQRLMELDSPLMRLELVSDLLAHTEIAE